MLRLTVTQTELNPVTFTAQVDKHQTINTRVISGVMRVSR